MTPVKAILFDWRGTLAASPSSARWIERSLRRAGRDASRLRIDEVRAAMRAAIGRPEIRAVWSRTDVSAAVHRSSNYAMFAAAGLDAELADVLYAEESDPANNAFAADTHRTLHALRAAGISIAVVSDIHFGLRPAFATAGLAGCVDSYVLSFEHRVQKPDAESSASHCSNCRWRPRGADGRRPGHPRRGSGRYRHPHPAPAGPA